MGKRKEKQGKKGRAGLVVLIIALVLAASCAALYFLAFDTLVFVTDSAYSLVVPSKDIFSLRLHCAAKGMRLKVVKLGDIVYENPGTFASAVSGIRGDYVILTPLVAEQALRTSTPVSQILSGSVVAAMTSEMRRGTFDVVLVSDEAGAWRETAAALAAELRPMSQNAALVCDSQVSFDIQNIVDSFESGRLTVCFSDGSRRLFNSETAQKLSEPSVVVAMCPHLSGMSDLIRATGSVSWVVDYRFADVVPSGNLYGIVAPDFRALADSLKGMEKGAVESLDLRFSYEKR